VNRTLTLAGADVPRIGLGTNRLEHTPANVAFVRQAVAAGVGLIDSAHLYTGGDSETTIGEALSPVPAGCVVATKGGFNPGEGTPDVLRGQLEESRRRLRTNRIELYYLHRVHPETPLEESLEALAEARERGAIGHVGLCEVRHRPDRAGARAGPRRSRAEPVQPLGAPLGRGRRLLRG
jgi:aryl-alcohol dehydrogenase-like predicted oxidoreductase